MRRRISILQDDSARKEPAGGRRWERVEETEERIRAASIATERQLQNEQLSASAAVADGVALALAVTVTDYGPLLYDVHGKSRGVGERETRKLVCARAHVAACMCE